MKFRKVERPESTTIYIETPYHLIKSEQELDNVMQDADVSQIQSVQRFIDSENFEIFAGFMVETHKSYDTDLVSGNLHYIVSIAYCDQYHILLQSNHENRS